ncbi:MAG: hypothetical protein R2719_10080 [Micropruina sp.]
MKVWLTNLPDPITMEFTRERASSPATTRSRCWCCLRVCATRLRASATDTPHSEVSHIENPFDARHELTNRRTGC